MTIIQPCQIGHKQLYFDLKLVQSILLAIESHYPIINYFLTREYLQLHNKGLKFLENGKILYEKIQARGYAFKSEDLNQIDKALNQAYQIRIDLFGYLQQICDDKELNSIDTELDRIHIDIEINGNIKDDVRVKFENKLNAFFNDIFISYFKNKLSEQNIKPAQNAKINDDLIKALTLDFFKDNYDLAYRWQLRIFLLISWGDQMQALLKKLPNQKDKITLGLAQIVKLQNILCHQKSTFFLSFYTHAAQYQQPVLAKLYSYTQNNLDSRTVLLQLENEYQTLLNNLNQKESQLKQYTWPQGLIAGAIRAPFNSHYYVLSESLMRIGEEISQTTSLQQVPILNEPLTEEYIKFFNIVGGLLLFSLDYYTSTRLTGLSYASVHALTQTLLSDLTPLLSMLNHIGSDEQSLIDNLPKLQWLVGLTVHLGFYALLFGASTGNLALFTLSYSCATTARTLVGSGFDIAKKWDTVNHFAHSMPRGFAFIKSITQGLGYSAGNILCYQYHDHIQSYFTTPDADNLLNEDNVCQRHAPACKETALSRLGLPSDATFKQIKSHWHQLTKRFHPDTFSQDLSTVEKTQRQTEFMQLAQAYERLEKLGQKFKQ